MRIPCKNWGEKQYFFGEARLVWEKPGPALVQAAPEAGPNKPKTVPSENPEATRQEELNRAGAKREAEKGAVTQGTKSALANLEKGVKTPEAAAQALESARKNIDGTSPSFEELWERLCKLFEKLFGTTSEELASAIKSPDTLSQKEPEREPDEGEAEEKSDTRYAERNLTRAKMIKEKLEQKPAGLEHNWHEYIQELGVKQWKIPEEYYVSLIEMESEFHQGTVNEDSGAMGLAQAMPPAIDEYVNKRYAAFKSSLNASEFKKEASALPEMNQLIDMKQKRELFKNPLVAIDFIGFHMRQKIKEANEWVEKEKAPPFYKLTLPEDGWDSARNKWYYMAYNSGGRGYVKLRQYLDQKTVQSHEQLVWFHKRRVSYDGHKMEDWEGDTIHARRVEEIAHFYATLGEGAEKLVAQFDSPPLPGHLTLTSGFGTRIHPIHHVERFHNGIDYGAPEGTPVLSVLPGTVEKTVPNQKVSGNYVVIRHDNGTRSLYLHLSKFAVQTGERVSSGVKIGEVGKTGTATGPHLHFIFKDQNGLYRNAAKLVADAAQENGHNVQNVQKA